MTFKVRAGKSNEQEEEKSLVDKEQSAGACQGITSPPAASRCARTPAPSSAAPARRRTKSSGRSPQRGCGSATAAVPGP